MFVIRSKRQMLGIIFIGIDHIHEGRLRSIAINILRRANRSGVHTNALHPSAEYRRHDSDNGTTPPNSRAEAAICSSNIV